MLKRKCLVIFLLVIFTVLPIFLVSYAGEEEAIKEELKPITLKLALLYPATSPEGRAVLHFKDLVEKYSEGNIKCDVYPGGQLGTFPAMVEGIQSGTIDMYFEGLNVFQSFSELLKLHNVPFVFRDRKQFLAQFDSQLFDDYVTKPLAEKNIYFINDEAGWNWHWGPYRVLVCEKHPVLKPDDIKGLKFRLPEIKAYVKAWKEIGATPVVVPWNEVYLALNQGVVDIVTSPISLLWDMKFTEVAKYVTKLDEFQQTMAVAISKSKYESLPEEYKKILVKACTEAGEYYTNIVYESADIIVEKCKKEHGAEFFETDYAPFIKRAEDAVRSLEKEGFLVPGLYDKLQALKK